MLGSSTRQQKQMGRHGGKIMWYYIRDIQKTRRGLMPERTAVVKDEERQRVHIS